MKLLDKDYVENCVTREVTLEEINLNKFKDLVADMKFMLFNTKGLGLAVPQVDAKDNIKMFIITMDNCLTFRVVYNPTITFYSPQKSDLREACLTYPQSIYGAVTISRPKTIGVSYIDEDGYKIECRLKGLESKVFQHEYEHLEGKTIFNR